MSSVSAIEKVTFGRKVIFSDAEEVTVNNVGKIVNDAITAHTINSTDINYLYNYYKGNQPILNRVKKVREDINNKIVVNHAFEIVTFKTSYLIGDPVQYVGHSEKVDSAAISTLNDFMYSENKAKKDEEIIEWNTICGTAYRFVKADEPTEVDDAPFEIFTLDPRNTFVVYSSAIGNKPLLGVNYIVDEYGVKHFTAYSDKYVFKFPDGCLVEAPSDGSGVKVTPNMLGTIPIFEYPANNARLGAFEIVLPLLDAINRLESNRLDGVEQQIQSFLKFVNCDVDTDDLDNLAEYGAIKLKSVDSSLAADVELVKTDFSQADAQVSKEDLYAAVVKICGLPTVNNGNSGISANNGASIVAHGWEQVEKRAAASEAMFKASENEMLKLILHICKYVGDNDLHLRSMDIEPKFTRRNYDDIQTKAQVLCEMLNNPHIHPKLAFEHSGMFSDPETAYTMSEAYYAEQQEKWEIETIPDEDGVNGTI